MVNEPLPESQVGGEAEAPKQEVEKASVGQALSAKLASGEGLIPSEILHKEIGKLGNFDIGFDGQAAKAELAVAFQEKFLQEFVSLKLNISGVAELQLKSLVDFILDTIKTKIKGPIDDIVIEAARPEIYKALGLK